MMLRPVDMRPKRMEIKPRTETTPAADRRQLLIALRSEFTGLRTSYKLADGRTADRIYLDSAASNLRLKPADEIVREALEHYASTHSQLHFGARIMTALYQQAHQSVRDFVNADAAYTAIFGR